MKADPALGAAAHFFRGGDPYFAVIPLMQFSPRVVQADVRWARLASKDWAMMGPKVPG